MPALSMTMLVGDKYVPVCIDMDDNSWDEIFSYCFPARCAAFLLKKRSF